MSNPYTLVFGQPPLEMVERTAQAERIISEFCQQSPSNYINLVTGIRGSGKTVFITSIAEKIGKRDGWIVVNLNPQRDLLMSLAAKLDSNQTLHNLFYRAKINLQAFGFGVEMSGVPPIHDIEEALQRMLGSIKNHDKRVLITIDEVTNSKEMRIFASSFQIFMRERLPVFLLMTGLYKNIDRLRNADGMTFLERAPRTFLLPLNFNEMTRKYMETLAVREDEATRLAAMTKGYAFAFQTIGYFFWENPESRGKAAEDAKEYLFEFAYWKIWSELSGVDKKVVKAVSEVPTGEISRIRELLSWSSNQFNPYRRRLLNAGVIISPENGRVELALPWFEEFVQQAG